MMRLTVLDAELVCSVAKTMWPVSAASMAAWIVSRSRISPTRITSGSIRSDDAVDRARRRAGVQRGEDDVAGFGRFDGRVDRIEIAHFADEDYVGIHPI